MTIDFASALAVSQGARPASAERLRAAASWLRVAAVEAEAGRQRTASGAVGVALQLLGGRGSGKRSSE